jgi:GntR family transcriptional regulator / MocR family aminotransferase
VERLARVRRSMEWQGDRVLEWAVADLFRDGEMARHLRRAHKVYESRRDFLVDRLNHELGDHLQAMAPEGGLALWVRIAGGIAETWIQTARHLGLVLNPPRHFYMDQTDAFTRIGFAQIGEDLLEEAVQRLKRALE